MESSPVAPDPIVTVPVADLLRVTPFKGDNDIRYYLNGVLVTPYEDHALLVATNGHWIGIYESKEARTDKARIIELPSWFLSQMIQAEHGGDIDDEGEEEESDDAPSYSPLPKTLVVNDEKSRLVVRQSCIEVLVKPGLPFIDGQFPDWTKVLPDPADLEPGLFAPIGVHYFAGLRDAIPNDRDYPLFCYHRRAASEKAMVFRFGNMPDLVVAVMPRRDTERAPSGWPKWMAPPAKENAA